MTKIIRFCLITPLLFTISCSQNELENMELLPDVNVINEDSDLASKLSNAKRITDGCDNPLKSGTTDEYYRIYTADEIGITNDINKVSSNRKTEEIDDRNCEYNYSQTSISGNMYGRYRLKAGLNRFDGDRLQPRIERASVTANSNTPGTRVRFKGVVRVFRVGDPNSSSRGAIDALSNNGGTYICQAKGTDTRTTNDPALALLLVKASEGSGSGQTKFKFFSEHMKNDNGDERSSTARKLYDFDFEVDNGDAVEVTMANQFTGTCDDLGHSVNIVLKKLPNGPEVSKTFNIPEPERGEQAKIRYGAYRCRGGEADIRWREGLSMSSVVGSACN